MKNLGRLIYAIGVFVVLFTVKGMGYDIFTHQYWFVVLGIIIVGFGKDIIDRYEE